MFWRRAWRNVPKAEPIPDLGTQLEDLIFTVWKSEARWRLDDRIDFAIKSREPLSMIGGGRQK